GIRDKLVTGVQTCALPISVTKQFGGFRAVADASISVEEGEIVGLIGPNGAGKSTMFNCLSGDLPPTSGRILYDGHDVTRASPERSEERRVGKECRSQGQPR